MSIILLHQFLCNLTLTHVSESLTVDMGRGRLLPMLCLLLLHLALTSSSNTTTNNNNNTDVIIRPRHKLAHLWPLQSIVGLVGVILNSIVFYMFVSERQNMANSVNILIW